MIVAIGKKDQGLSSLLFLYFFIRRQQDRVVQNRAGALLASSSRRASIRVAALQLAGRAFGVVQSRLQLLSRRRKILHQFGFGVEFDEKRLILVLAHHLLDELRGRVFFFAQHMVLAAAGIGHQAKRQRQIGFPCKVFDDLWASILFNCKVFLL